MHEEKDAFILAWSVSIWKRIWICAYLYCEHQNVPLSTNIIWKSLKYNLLSPDGITLQILPHLEKALSQGFLMPKEYKNETYVKRAIALFGETFRLIRFDDKKKQKEMIKDIVFSITNEDKEKEIKDIKTEKIEGYHCSFCQAMDVWDIELALYMPKNQVHQELIYTILKSLLL